MKAVCPNSLEHDRFIVSAKVTQDWMVDDKGNYIETTDTCSDVLEYPNKYETWTCSECGVEAIIED